MKALGPEIPGWLVKLIEKIPEPSPKTVETIYGLLIWCLVVQAIVTLLLALGSH